MRLGVLAVLLASVAGAAMAQTGGAQPGLVQTAGERGPGTITTHATARGRLANTVADVSIGVEAHAPTVQATQVALAAGSNKLLGALQQFGVERLRTEQLSITPHTVADKGQPDRIVGYDGHVLASFRVPAERLADAVSAGLGNGANDLGGVSLAPREAEMDAERARLAADAAKTALAQARAVAEATGERLAAIRRIDVDPAPGFRGPMAPAPMMRAAIAAAPISTEAGDAEITATVTVTVDLATP